MIDNIVVLTQKGAHAIMYKHGGIAQSVEQTAHIRSVIGSSPIAAIIEKR